MGEQTFTETNYISFYSENSQCEFLGTTKWRGVTVKVYKCREDDTEITIYTPDDVTPVYMHGAVSIESGGTAILTCELLNITKPPLK